MIQVILSFGYGINLYTFFKGRRLGPYILESKLGKGGFGMVFLARHDDGKPCAIKVPLVIGYTVNDQEQEVSTRISKQHENIVKIHEFIPGFTPYQTCCVLEFCNCGDLNDFVISKKPQLPVVLDFMVGMAKGVNFLHTRRICHRDLKPHNVLVQKEQDRFICKITDFGLSAVMTKSYFSDVCGSLMFMAPEVADGMKYSYPADVFSLGLLFYCLIAKTEAEDSAGRHIVPLVPFKDEQVTLTYLIRRNRLLQATFIQKHFRDIERLGIAVYKMLAYEPEERSELGDVIADIADIKGEYRGKELVEHPEMSAPVTALWLKELLRREQPRVQAEGARGYLPQGGEGGPSPRQRRDSFEDDVINGIIPVSM